MKTNKRIQKALKQAKEDWIGIQCNEIESNREHQLVKDLTLGYVAVLD